VTGHEPVGSPPRGGLPLVAVVAVSIGAGLLAWLLLLPRFDDDDFKGPRIARKASSGALAAPQLVSEGSLKTFAGQVGHPVYWAGPKAGFNYEYTRTSDGRVFIRYLPKEERIGSTAPRFRFVATYPEPRAYTKVRETAKLKGSIVRKLRGGGLAVANTRGVEIVRSTAVPLPSPPVFFAKPGSKVLVEVFDLSMRDSLRLVTSGQVRPVVQ
jgi:hypothetical protein